MQGYYNSFNLQANKKISGSFRGHIYVFFFLAFTHSNVYNVFSPQCFQETLFSYGIQLEKHPL